MFKVSIIGIRAMYMLLFFVDYLKRTVNFSQENIWNKICITDYKTTVLELLLQTVSTEWLPAINSQGTKVRPLEVFLGKSVLKICSKFTGEHPCWSVISSNRNWNYTLAWAFSLNLLHIFRTPFPKNTSGGLLLWMQHVSLVILFPCMTIIFSQPSKKIFFWPHATIYL